MRQSLIDELFEVITAGWTNYDWETVTPDDVKFAISEWLQQGGGVAIMASTKRAFEDHMGWDSPDDDTRSPITAITGEVRHMGPVTSIYLHRSAFTNCDELFDGRDGDIPLAQIGSDEAIDDAKDASLIVQIIKGYMHLNIERSILQMLTESLNGVAPQALERIADELGRSTTGVTAQYNFTIDTAYAKKIAIFIRRVINLCNLSSHIAKMQMDRNGKS